MSEEEIRVMLVDDHNAFREPLAFMLEREPDLTVVAHAGSLNTAREVLENDDVSVDVAVVDLNLPDGSGTDFVAELRRARPKAKALILSAISQESQLARAIEAGAAGVMHKSARMEDLVRAVRGLHAGEALLSQQEVIAALRLVGRESEAKFAISKLTPREREVLQALAEGSGDKEIAQRLHVGVGTVRSHLTSILAKLEVQSRLQALVFAVRHGIVEID